MKGIPAAYWAKFAHIEGSSPEYLPLIDHLIDVATCFGSLLETGYSHPLALSAGFSKFTAAQKDRLCFLAFLHDLGKASVDFQRQIFPDESQLRRHKGHTKICTYFLTGNKSNAYRQFSDALPTNCGSWFSFPEEDGLETFARMLLASWGHHGRPINFDLVSADQECADVAWDGWRYVNFEEFISQAVETATSAWPGVLDEDQPIPATSSFMAEFNGLLQLADWIASDKALFPYNRESDSRVGSSFASEQMEFFLHKTGRKAKALDVSFKGAFGFEPNAMQMSFGVISAEIIQ